MIRNIVFDMGNVLVTFDPDSIARHFIPDPQDAQTVSQALFGGPGWVRLDAGAAREEEVLAQACAQLPSRLHQPCRTVLECWHQQLPVIPGSLELAQRLKGAGLGLYLCSNASDRFQAYQHTIPALSLMDGLVVSAFERCLKPHPQIYRTLFQRFSLHPQECYFIDDRQDNLQGARALGMEGYLFDGNYPKLERHLENLLPQLRG